MASKSDLARRKFALMAAEYLQRMGERMAERRKELGLTQEQVARQLPGETSGAHVSRWERGLHRPSDDTLEALAKVLGVDVSYFLAAQADKSEGTPDPFASPSDELRAQLARLEEKLVARTEHDTKIAQMLEQQTAILQQIERALKLTLQNAGLIPAEEPAGEPVPDRIPDLPAEAPARRQGA